MVNPQGGEEDCNPSQPPDIITDEGSDLAGLVSPGRKHHASHEPSQNEKEEVLRQRHQTEKKLPTCIGWSDGCRNPHKRRLHSVRKSALNFRRLDCNVLVVKRPSASLNHLGTNALGPRTVREIVDAERFQYGYCRDQRHYQQGNPTK